jgi:hypothetical protein
VKRASLLETIWCQSSVPVFLEKFFLVLCAGLFLTCVIGNNMHIDNQYRIGLGIIILGVAYMVAHAVYNTNYPPVLLRPATPPGVEPLSAERKPADSDKAHKQKKVLPKREKPNIHVEQHGGPNAATFGDNSPVTINPEVNPYAPVVTYEFNGFKHVQQGNSIQAEAGEEHQVFREMLELEKRQDWKALLNLCEEQITKTPLWLTPYMCSGVSFANLGEKDRAIERLKYVEKMYAGDQKYFPAIELLRHLENRPATQN